MRASISRRRCASPTAWAGTSVAGHVDGLGTRRRDRHPTRARSAGRSSCRPTLARYIAREGLDRVDGVSLTVNDVDGRPLRRQPDSAHDRRHRRSATRTGRRARQHRESTRSRATSSGCFAEREDAHMSFDDRSRNPRRHPRRPHGRHRRRRGPRERRRPDHGRREGAAGGRQLHGARGARPGLPDADAARTAASSACSRWSATTRRRTTPTSRSRSRRPRGVTTGISAHDRAHTIRTAAAPTRGPTTSGAARPHLPAHRAARRRARRAPATPRPAAIWPRSRASSRPACWSRS